jgi:Zn-dependent protease
MGAKLGDLVISIAGDIAKLVSAMDKAEYVTTQTAKKIDQAMAMAEKSIVVLGASFVSLKTASAFKDNVDAAIEFTASLDDMARQFGTTASELSRFRTQAAQSNTDLRTVGGGLQALSRSMYETAQGTGRARDVFIGLGLSVKDTVTGKLKDGATFMVEVAKKLDGMANSTERVGAAQKIMRGVGADLLPFFHLLAEQGVQDAKVTDEQATAAKHYTDTLVLLAGVKKQVYQLFAMQVLPVYQAVADVLLELAKQAGGVLDVTKRLAAENKIREWAADIVIGIGMVIDSLSYVTFGVKVVGNAIGVVAVFFVECFKNIGTVIGVTSASLGDFAQLLQGVGLILSGQFTVGAAVVADAWDRISMGADQIKERFTESFDNIAFAGQEFMDKFAQMALDFNGPGVVDKFLDALAKMGDATKKLKKDTGDTSEIITKFRKDAVDGLAASLAKDNAALEANIAHLRQFGTETKATTVASVEAQLTEMKSSGALAEHARRTGESVDAVRKRILALAEQKDMLVTNLEWEKKYQDTLNGLTDDIRKQLEVNATFGMAADQVSHYKVEQMELVKAVMEVTGVHQDFILALQTIIDKTKELEKAQKQGRYIQDMVDGWKSAAGYVTEFAKAVVGGETAVEALRNTLKKLRDELIDIFLRKWILELGASLVGGQAGSALSTAAGNVGQGTLSSLIGTWLGSTAVGQGFQMGWAGIAGPQQTALGGYAQQFGAALKGAAGPLMYFAIAVAGAAIAAHQYAAGWRLSGTNNTSTSLGGIFSGGESGIPGATWMGSAMDRTYRALGFNDQWAAILSGSSMVQRMFGHRQRQGDAYGITGTIGPGSFTGRNWQDWSEQGGWFTSTNRGTDNSPFSTTQTGMFNAMMSSITQVVGPLAQTLGTTLAQGLAGYSHSFNVQLSNNGEYDPTELQNLFGSVLQEQTALLLRNAGDTRWADYITGLTETGEALQATITEFVASYVGLKMLNLKGLDMTALQAWKQGTESIGQTFQRVATQIGQFDDAFMTDAQKWVRAQGTITDTFHDLGIAVPKNAQEFYDLVHGLDLSTEAGRHMFDTLMQVAPAFLSVTRAAEQAVASFNSIASQLSPGYGSIVNHQGFGSALSRFNQYLTSVGGTAWTQSQAMANIHQWMANPATMQSALAYAQSLGGNAVQLITDLLTSYQTLNASTNSTADAVTGLGNAASGAAAAWQDAQRGIVDWLGGFLTSDLSPLNNTQKYEYVQNEYMANAAMLKKNPHNVDALNAYTSLAQQYIEAARARYGSGAQYQQIVATVTGEAAQFGGLVDAKGHPTTAADTDAQTKAIVAAIKSLETSLGHVVAEVKKTTKATKDSGVRVNQAVRDGSLTYSR